jgi:hypothetical protein
MQCPKCSEKDLLRRIERVGLLQQKVYPFFGYYPWECSVCRKCVLVKNRGERRRSKRTVRPSRSRIVLH